MLSGHVDTCANVWARRTSRRLNAGLHAVLFLLLISGETLKWVVLTTDQLNGIGILQLILTGCVGFSVAIWMIMNPRKVYKSITVSAFAGAPQRRESVGMQGHCTRL